MADKDQGRRGGDWPGVPPEVEEALARATASLSPTDAASVLVETAHRATNLLYKLTRQNSDAHRGQSDWSAWARLQNASRDAVLRTASCRQSLRLIESRSVSSEDAAGDASGDASGQTPE